MKDGGSIFINSGTGANFYCKEKILTSNYISEDPWNIQKMLAIIRKHHKTRQKKKDGKYI